MATKIEIEMSATDKHLEMGRNLVFDPEAQPAEVLIGRLLYNIIEMFFDLLEVKEEKGDESNNGNRK